MDVLLNNAESSHRLQRSQHLDKDTICPRCVNAQLVRVSLMVETSGQSPTHWILIASLCYCVTKQSTQLSMYHLVFKW